MKKYNKPELKVEIILTDSNIAAEIISSTLPHINDFGNDAGTVTWDDLFGN